MPLDNPTLAHYVSKLSLDVRRVEWQLAALLYIYIYIFFKS